MRKKILAFCLMASILFSSFSAPISQHGFAEEQMNEPLPKSTVTAVPTEAEELLTFSAETKTEMLPSAESVEPSPTPSAAPKTVYYCETDAHTHAEECYASGGLVCFLPEHIHTNECTLKLPPSTAPETEPMETLLPEPSPSEMTPEELPVTEQPSPEFSPSTTPSDTGFLCPFEEHQHNVSCYLDGVTVCSIEEHAHSDLCQPQSMETAVPQPTPASTEETVQYHCTFEEHSHSDICADASGAFICGFDEHIHTEICLYAPLVIDINLPQTAIQLDETVLLTLSISGGKAPYQLSFTDHLSIDEAYTISADGIHEMNWTASAPGEYLLSLLVSDANGSIEAIEEILIVEEMLLETQEDWVASFAHLQLGSNVRENVLSIMQTQVGYTESQTDFVMIDGQQKGYTRYGAWFGSPYQDWCAMFAAFCLHYAHVDEQIPLSGSVPAWIESLRSSNVFREKDAYIPETGDLVFFDHDHDGNGDHVALISKVIIDDQAMNIVLQTIEGNVNNEVVCREYTLSDSVIIGFGQIAENESMTAIQLAEEAIALLPSLDEIETVMQALEDIHAQNAYLLQITEQYTSASDAYKALGAFKQNYVANGDLLAELAMLATAQTLEEPAGGTADAPVERTDDLQSVGRSSGIRFRLFNYDERINQNGHQSVFGFRGANKHDPEGDDTVINQTLDADGYVANRAKVKPLLSNGYPVFDGRGTTSDFSLGYLFGAGGNGVTAYSPVNTPLLRSSANNLYRYDSARNAVDYDTSSNRFIVRSYIERGDSTAGFGGQYADFMPFTYWNNATVLTNEKGVEYFYDSDKELDYWFGMTMDTTFFQPKNGHIADDEMIFSFSGDDDVWVFIDDVLVLDLGGTHGVVTGSINFATGEIIQHLNWNGSTTPSYPTTLKECFAKAGKEPSGGWNASGTTFADYSKHTFKFFYLERGAGSSNCKMTFNLPTLPDESLTVTKELVGDGANAETGSFIENTLEYAFRVVRADEEGNASDAFFLLPGTEYTLLKNGAAIGTDVIREDGTFVLKAGQSAQFSEMIAKGDGAIRYVVQEIMPNDLTGQYGSVEYEVSGAGGETKTEEKPVSAFTAFQTSVLNADESQIVTFHNKVAVNQLSMLKLTKQQAQGSTFTPEQPFEIQVQLGGELLPVGTQYAIDGTEEIRTVDQPGMVVLKIGETATVLKGILSGTDYVITELPAEDKIIHPVFSGSITQNGSTQSIAFAEEKAQGTFPLNSTVHIVVTNASYDFAAELVLSKQAIGNHGSESFDFMVEQVVLENNQWTPVAALPGTTVVVEDEEIAYGKIVLGFSSGTDDVLYYQISEDASKEGFLNDPTYYIVEISVNSDRAEVTSIWKNGTELITSDNPLSFVNYKTIPITIEKTVTGIANPSSDDRFVFTLTIDDDTSFAFPVSDQYEKLSDHSIRFSLAHSQQLTIPHVPYLSTITISESGYEGYTVSHRISPESEPAIGSTVTLNDVSSHAFITFINHGGYMLPETGGHGTSLYTAGGLCLLGVAYLLYRFQKRWKGGY